MGKLINMTGQRFGRLTVKEYAGDSKWLCKCDCGNLVEIRTSNLTNGHTKSCGCLAREQSSVNGKKALMDLEGKEFGNLTAVKYDTAIKKWLCQCKCGNTCYVSQNNLLRGTRGTKSCGCISDLDKANKANMVDGTNLGALKSHKAFANSSTGIRGVCYSKARKAYVANIGFKGKQYVLTTSKDIQVCIAARKQAEKEIYGEFLEWYEQYKNEK